MRFTCDKCGRVYSVAAELSRRAFKMKCKACGATIAVSADEPLTPTVPEENPFVVTPVRASRVPPAAPIARPPAQPPARAAEPSPALVAAASPPAPFFEEANAPGAIAALDVELAFPVADLAHADPAPDRDAERSNGARSNGATVHVLSPPRRGAPKPGLALAVNDALHAPPPAAEEPDRPAAPAPRRSVTAVPNPPEPEPTPPRRRLIPVALAALLGVALGGAFVGMLLLRDRHAAPPPRPVDPVAAAPSPANPPEARAPAPPPAASPNPAPEVAAAAPPAATREPVTPPAPRNARRASAAERRAEAAPVADAKRSEAPPALPPDRSTAPAPEPVAPAPVAAAEPVTDAPPPAALPAPEEAPRTAGSKFKAPQLAEKSCIASNLSLPAPVEGGPVTVRLAVSASGAVSQIQVLGTSDPQVADAIRQAVGKCTWTPGADAEGRPTSLWVVQRIRFAQ